MLLYLMSTATRTFTESYLSFRFLREFPRLKKQPTYPDATASFPAKTRLRNECRNSILMARHYSDLGNASDWLKICFGQSETLPRSE